MLEVETKFQPTDEQLDNLLLDAKYIGEIIINDTYYDFIDYRHMKSGNRLRKRNGDYELKINSDKDGIHAMNEITDESEIKKYFLWDSDVDINTLVTNEMIVVCEFQTKRKKYKKDEFNIDVDQMSFEENVVEIEILVEDILDIHDANNKIVDLANSFGFEFKNLDGKVKMCLKKINPDLYREIFEK